MIDSVSSEDDLKRGRRVRRPQATAGAIDRLPPHAPESERGVLGCVLLEPSSCLDEAALGLPEAEAFYDLRNRHVWLAILKLRAAGTAIDLITLQEQLKKEGLLEQVGGLAYISTLPDAVPSAANLSYYLAIVREKFTLRKWITLCADVVGRVYDYEGEVEALIAEISTRLFQLCEAGMSAREKSMREVVVEVSTEVLEKFRRGVKFSIGPGTGFNYLDNILPGLGAGQLIVLGARPRTGKTALLMQTAEFIAEVCRQPVAVFSLEMTARSLGTRAIFQRGGADLTKFLNGFMSEADVQKLTVAGTQLSKLPIYIDESPRMSIEELEIRARRLVRSRGVRVIFVDYFQLLYVRNRHRQWSKADEMAECSMRLKGLAKELKVPVFLCAQLNREIEKETHRRPRLSDLKDTGQLEQDADVAMFLWKPDVSSETWEKKVQDILPRVPVPSDWKDGRAWKKNLSIVTCTVEKQREGRSGEDATLVFIKPWTRFVDAYRPIGTQEQLPEPEAKGQDEQDLQDEGEMPTNEELGLE